MTERIPVFRPRLVPASHYLHRLEKIDLARVYTNFGEQSEEFAGRVADHFNVDAAQVVLGSSATSLLTGAATLLQGDKYYCPAWTFAATPLALSNSGSSIAFVDVDPESHIANFSEVQTGSHVVVVSPFGKAVTIGAEFNRFRSVIVDAAASVAHPTQISGGFSNIDSLIEVYSFHATKILGIGEGSAAIVRNKQLASRLRAWTNFGFNGHRVSDQAGSNAKMSEFSAAIGCETFAQAGAEFLDWQEARTKARAVEFKLGLSPFFDSDDHIAPYWIAKLPPHVSVQAVSQRLDEKNIDSRRWWGPGCHVAPFFSAVEKVGPLKGTQKVAGTTIGLPFARDLDQDAFSRIEAALAGILA